jgi:hypothetical protein
METGRRIPNGSPVNEEPRVGIEEARCKCSIDCFQMGFYYGNLRICMHLLLLSSRLRSRSVDVISGNRFIPGLMHSQNTGKKILNGLDYADAHYGIKDFISRLIHTGHTTRDI